MGMLRAFLLVCALVSFTAEASNLPACLGKDKKPMAPNNEQVLNWKENSPNQYKDRGFVMGKLVGVTLDRKSHLQLAIDIGVAGSPQAREEQIEIIYNKEFGSVGSFTSGMDVAACGDYITAREKAGNYVPSPLGAIIHWVHVSPDPKKHASGFLAINGKVFGQQMPAQPRGFFEALTEMALSY
jgi:hypothetical protein